MRFVVVGARVDAVELSANLFPFSDLSGSATSLVCGMGRIGKNDGFRGARAKFRRPAYL